MVALEYALEGGFDLKVPLGFPYQDWHYTHYLTTSDSFFLKGRFFRDLHCFIRGKLRIAPLKRACARKLRILIVNYTQLTIKVKFFCKKTDSSEIVMSRAVFQPRTL